MTALAGWAALAGTGLGLGLWSLVSLVPRIGGPRLMHRVAPYLIDVSEGARELVGRRPVNPLPVFGMLLSPLAERLRAWTAPGSGQLELRLRQAGASHSIEEFRAQQLAWAVVGAAAGVVLAIAIGRTQPVPIVVSVLLVVVLAVVGFLARERMLQGAARRRMARMAAELPTVLEFLTLSLSAGEGILDSLRRVTRTASGDLTVELGRAVNAFNSGVPLTTALSQVASSLQLPALDRAIDQLTGAIERGTPLAEVLRAQAQDAREQARNELAEVAGKKEIAMLVPLVFLILPVTIIFAVFPGVFVLQLGF